MAEFDFDEYAGIGGLGAAVKGFAQGWQDGEDRKMKRLEMESKMDANKIERSRHEFLDSMTMREKGYKVNGKVDYSKQPEIDTAHRQGEAITKLAPSGMSPEFDAEANVTAVNPNNALIKAKRIGEGGSLIKDDPFATDLRTKWLNDPTTKATRDVETAYSKILKASSNPTAAGDLSLIFGYMKMQDPSSTVREGEQLSAQQAAGLGDQLANAYERARTGKRLTPEQRDDFVNQAKNMYEGQMQQQESFNETFRELAKTSGLKPDSIVLNRMFKRPQEPVPKEKVNIRGAGPQANPQGLLNVGNGLMSSGVLQAPPASISGQPANGPQVGSVDGGYEFMGGDPNDKKNWKKVDTKAARK